MLLQEFGLVISIFIGVITAGEPNCRYEHDYYVLQKLVSLEARVDQLETENKRNPCNRTCDNGWVTFDGKCYLFNDQYEQTWDEAVSDCGTHGAKLVTVQSRQEDLFLQRLAQRLFKGESFKGKGFWFGATSIKPGNAWVWYTDGSMVRDGYTNWVLGQGEGGRASDPAQTCGIFWGNDKFKWHDHFCTHKTYTICEK